MTDTAPATPPITPTVRLSFDVEPHMAFGMIAKTGDGGSALGIRMASCVLAAPDFFDLVGMTYYGLTNVQRVAIQEPTAPYTIADIDSALREIVPHAVRIGEAGWSRPHTMLTAASKAWIEQRPEDRHTRVIRAGLRDLDEDGTLKPSDGVWPEN